MAYITLSGILVDANGSPIPKAEIKFVATATSKEVLEHTTAVSETDINGEYTLNLNYGRYDIHIRLADQVAHSVLVRNVIVNADVTEDNLNELIANTNDSELITPEILSIIRNLEESATNAATIATNKASEAATSEAFANQHKDDAATSASEALASQQAAATSESNADQSAQAAATSESNAATSETNASNSASAALTSQQAAANSESNADQSAQAAATSEGNAATSEINASNSASAALASQQAAATSEANADQSAQAAATSESNAATSETNAASSANDSANSATASAASAQSASDSLSGATSAQIAAGNYASAAATSATNASNSANSAATSETNAAQSAAEAAQSAQQAQTAASSAVQYLGGWDASSGSLPPTTGVTDGDQYRVTVAGTVNSVDYNVGDFIFFDSGAWQLVDNTDSVTSVAGKTGAITLTKSDVGLSNVRNVSSYSQTETDGLLNTKLGSTESAVSADKLTTARTITLAGDLSGSVGFDGSQNVTITTTVNNSDKLDGLQASQFVRNDTTNTISGIQKFTGHVRWQVSDSDVAFQNADARDEGTRSRLHWYGGSAGSSLNAAHAYYDGTNYHNLDVIQGEFRFDAGVYASGGFRGDGSQIVNVNAQTLDGINSTQFLRSDVNDTKTGYLWLQDELLIGNSAANSARLRVVGDASRVYIQSYDKDDTNTAKEFVFSGYGGKDIGEFRVRHSGTYQDIWHSGNDGAGSGLDADTVDGLHGYQLLRSDADDSTTGFLQAAGFVNRDDSTVGGLRISLPDGGSYATSSSIVTGAIKITLPVSWTNTMMKMVVRVFEYTANESFDVYLSGYNYSSNQSWNNTTGYVIGSTKRNRDFRIRYGHDGNKCCIYIGELTDQWAYPQIFISEFQAGFSYTSTNIWHSGWNIDIVDSFGTITEIKENTQIGRYVDNYPVWHKGNDGADSGLDADLLDGLHGYQLVRSDTADTVSGRLTLTNSGGTETHYGIHGGYNDSNGNGTGWGAPIWSMGDGFMGTGTGANFSAPGGYQLAWQRAGNANSRSEIGEGVYIYSANLFAGGIGRDGAHLARGLTVTGNASVSGDITSNGHRVYHGGNIHFSTSDPSSSDGQDGDIWFVYED